MASSLPKVNGELIAQSRRCYRVLETNHPPTYYIPPTDVRLQYLRPSSRTSFCEFKGAACYWTVQVGSQTAVDAAWSYPDPSPAFLPIRDYLAFYPGRVQECRVGGERVRPQPGDFYGGWITSKVVGPFKGEPGSWNW
ncbi:DUF427 domain-containing protein [Synechococcus sp. R55.6]|uniref:DUF427 domain-containing protein n=1 Tax=unclassified Synechococcus TaxID=2626047 RepID=UPI0039C29D38